MATTAVSAAGADEATVMLNTFIKSADPLSRAFIHYSFLRFVEARLRIKGGLGQYDIVIPSDSLTTWRATIDLRGCTSINDVLARNIVWRDSSRPLSSVVGSRQVVSYQSSLFETYM